MTDPATPKALRVIAAAMREPLYQTDMHGIEALVLENAADEIELLGKHFVEANEDEVKFRTMWAEAKAENDKLKKAVNDLSQYISRADYCYLTKETVFVLEGK